MSNPLSYDVAILGGGIAGLVTAYLLKEQGISSCILESENHPGGKIRTEKSQGYLVEHGPNSLQTATPLLNRLIDTLGITEDRVFASAAAKKRFVVQYGQPESLPMSPPALIGSSLFSWRAKLNLLREPLIKRANFEEEESVASFVRRRLGQEILDYAVDPFVTGIFAGNPETLAIQHAFPTLYQLEQNHGSLLRGLIVGRKATNEGEEKPVRRIFSFRNGMQTLIDALSSAVSDQLFLESRVINLSRRDNHWEVTTRLPDREARFQTRAVVSTLPLPALREVSLDGTTPFETFEHVSYPAVSVLALGFRRDEVLHPLDGFGMLAPGCESSTRILGTIFSSSVFPDRAPTDHVLLTTLIGGARHPDLGNLPIDLLLDVVQTDLHDLLGVHGDPTFIKHILWPQAIPQYDLGYGSIKLQLSEFEADLPGLHFAGNYRAGIAVGEAVNSAASAAQAVLRQLS